MEVGWYTSGYIVREETQREKLKGRPGMRAWRGEIAKLCWEEMRDRARERKMIGR